MKSLVLSLLFLSAGALAQNAIPPGTIIPIQLNSSLNSRKSQPGKTITARIMQDVPISRGQKIRAGTKMVGRIVAVQAARMGQPAQISFAFETLHRHHESVAVTANLRALASTMEVEDAQVPPSGPDRGTPWTWVTRNLIGGEIAYGDGGPVARGIDVVGQALAEGVLVSVEANVPLGCRGAVAGNDQPQALWVFSSDACGLYGLEGVEIAHAGRTAPLGQITLTSTLRNFTVRSGSGLLLRVHGAPA